MVTEVYFNKTIGLYTKRAGFGLISDGVPTVITGSGDTDVDKTKRYRKVRS